MRIAFALIFLALAANAAANAVMGVALEQYDSRAWLVYVVTTVVFEAWAIGRWAGGSWAKALGISLLANFVTAGCCANLCGVALHMPFVGSRLNPNPLLNMLVMFAFFGLVSGCVESIVWRLFFRAKDNPLLFRTVAAHLIWVPVGMAIMLVPSRPYPFLEGYTLYARKFYAQGLRAALEAKIAEHDTIPDYGDVAKLFRDLQPRYGSDLDGWAAAYRPLFGRFSIGEKGGEPLWEWNPKATGLDITSKKMPDHIWLLRTKPRSGEGGAGFVWQDGLRFTRSSSDLLYPNP